MKERAVPRVPSQAVLWARLLPSPKHLFSRLSTGVAFPGHLGLPELTEPLCRVAVVSSESELVFHGSDTWRVAAPLVSTLAPDLLISALCAPS